MNQCEEVVVLQLDGSTYQPAYCTGITRALAVMMRASLIDLYM